MAKCEVCGNSYDKSFTVTMASETHTFDSFECAIHALAPHCAWVMVILARDFTYLRPVNWSSGVTRAMRCCMCYWRWQP